MLSLIAISERLDIKAIATLDRDFDVYRRYRKQHERSSIFAEEALNKFVYKTK